MKHAETAYKMLRKIPRGKVVTYKELARALGNKKMARHVGTLMKCNNTSAPCYKVVRSDGYIGLYSGPGGAAAKAKMLRMDGIEIVDGKVDLGKYGFTL